MADPLTIFVAPNGVDANNQGRNSNAPIATLKRALEVCKEISPLANASIDIRVREGVYSNQPPGLHWDYYTPGPNHTVRILGSPVGNGDDGFPSDDANTPRFIGPAGESVWLYLPGTRGKDESHFVIQGLRIENYHTAIIGTKTWGNTISHCSFRNIGRTTISPAGQSAGVIILQHHSNRNVVKRCFFRKCLNIVDPAFPGGGQQRAFHALYIAYGSCGNVIEGNNVSVISGPPIKVRDGSNHNIITGNRFFQITDPSPDNLRCAYLEQYSPRLNQELSKRQSPSFYNVFRGNTFVPQAGLPTIAAIVRYREFDASCPDGRRTIPRLTVENNTGSPTANTMRFTDVVPASANLNLVEAPHSDLDELAAGLEEAALDRLM